MTKPVARRQHHPRDSPDRHNDPDSALSPGWRTTPAGQALVTRYRCLSEADEGLSRTADRRPLLGIGGARTPECGPHTVRKRSARQRCPSKWSRTSRNCGENPPSRHPVVATRPITGDKDTVCQRDLHHLHRRAKSLRKPSDPELPLQLDPDAGVLRDHTTGHPTTSRSGTTTPMHDYAPCRLRLAPGQPACDIRPRRSTQIVDKPYAEKPRLEPVPPLFTLRGSRDR